MFTMTFETDNATFGETDQERNAECAKILRAVAKALEQGVSRERITDPNGNTVGTFEVNSEAEIRGRFRRG